MMGANPDEVNSAADAEKLPVSPDLHGLAKKGIKLLFGRQVALQIAISLGGIVLARTLNPAEFGLYAVATFLVGILAMLGDFGLAPSFIQRKAELTDRDLGVGFTLQQIITTLVVIVLVIAAPWLAKLYPEAPPETVWLVRVLAFCLYLTSWRSICALQLERHLQYGRLTLAEVVESLVYQVVAVGLALLGFGVWSFVWATLLRGVIGTIMVYLAAPWKIRLEFDREIVQEILRFGVPFQLQNLANSGGEWVTPLFVGSMLGPQAVGYLGWALGNGKKPLALLSNVMRVAFPHFSRIQHDRIEVERVLIRYLNWLVPICGFWFSLMLVAGPSLVHSIFTSKWDPAIPALILSAAALTFDAISWMVVLALNGLGVISLTTRLTFLRTVVYIVLSLPMVYWMGFNAVPLVYLLVAVVNTPLLIRGLGRGAIWRVLMPLQWLLLPIAATCALGLATSWLVLPAATPIIVRASALTLLVSLLYNFLCIVAAPPWLREILGEKISSRFAPRAA